MSRDYTHEKDCMCHLCLEPSLPELEATKTKEGTVYKPKPYTKEDIDRLNRIANDITKRHMERCRGENET